MNPHEGFHEVWWIYAASDSEWGGLRLAHFRKTSDGTLLVIISNEVDRNRIGVRVWDDIARREGWVKVAQIAVPTAEQVRAALP